RPIIRSTSPHTMKTRLIIERSESASDSHQDLQRLGNLLELVAEIDADGAVDAQAESDAFQHLRVVRSGAHAAGVEEAKRLHSAAPAERVFEVDQIQGVADGLLELVAVDRSDAAEREQALRRQHPARPPADGANREVLMLGQR